MSRIPLVLIAGFLGAGKTTFLRALMERLQERKIGCSVVVNDFENAEIDAARLRTLNTEVRAIDGSCVCCGSLNEFISTLGEIQVPQGGVMLVEANGASDFITLIATLTARQETRRFTSPLQVTLLDVKRWQCRGEHNDLEAEQVQTSTHWMFTHDADATAERLDEMKSAVAKLTPRGRQAHADSLADELSFLSARHRFSARSTEPQKVFDEKLESSSHVHHHERERAFTAIRVDLPFVVNRKDLERTLSELPVEVVRVKGLCRLAELPTIPMSFQHVRPQTETWFLPMLNTQAIIPTGIVIGVGLPIAQIAIAFEKLSLANLNVAQSSSSQ